ncbi:hypothetical protein HOLleu_24699 [Holothuria leucospilota]|uniref:Uncharacterized protein n=1 Tax=Holothuria leucospilota TaxID=206669 RepID=A0A9Q1BRR6_HOLLE|nr:hypothetical protein HOLleu_24699 [Holothuria leucospilota]
MHISPRGEMSFWRGFCVIIIIISVNDASDNSDEAQWGTYCRELPDFERRYKEICLGSDLSISCDISSNCIRGLWRTVIPGDYVEDCRDGKETSKCVETRGKQNMLLIYNVSTDDLGAFECRCDDPEVNTSNTLINCFLLKTKTQTNDNKSLRSFSCNQVLKQSQVATKNVYVGEIIQMKCRHKTAKSDCPFNKDTTTGNFGVEYSKRPCNISCVTPAGEEDCFVTFQTLSGPSSTPATSYITRSRESTTSTTLGITPDFSTTKWSPYNVFVILPIALSCTVIAIFLLVLLGMYINNSQSKRTQGPYLDLVPNPPVLGDNYTLLRQNCNANPLNASGLDKNLYSIYRKDQSIVNHEYSSIRTNNIGNDESKTGYPHPESSSYVPMDIGSRNLQRKTRSAELLNTMALYDNPLNMRHGRSQELFPHEYASIKSGSKTSERFTALRSSRQNSSMHDNVPLDHCRPGFCTTLHTEAEYEKMTAQTSVLQDAEKYIYN